MGKIKKEKSFFRKFIDFYTTQAVSDRGKNLYRKDRVQLISIDESKDIARFNVQGTRLYDVTIRGFMKGDLDAICTCPYDWGSVCKHSVAALLFLEDYLENNSGKIIKVEKTIHKYRKSDEPFPIPYYNYLTVEDILKNSSSGKYSYEFHDLKVQLINSEKGYLQFNLMDYWNDIRAEIEIFRTEEGKVFIRNLMDDGLKYKGLTEDESSLLIKIAQSPNPDFLDLYFNNKLDDQKKIILQTYGLPEITDFDKYFYLGFTVEKGLYVEKKQKALGLIPVSSKENEVFRWLQKISNVSIDDKMLVSKATNMGIGFLIYRKTYNRDENQFYRLKPISGKLNKNKTKLISSFSVVERGRYIEIDNLSETQKELFSICRDFDVIYNTKDVNYQKLLSLWGKSYNLLSEEQFVFITNDFDPEYDKKLTKNSLIPVKMSGDKAVLEFKVKTSKEFITCFPVLKIAQDETSVKQINKELTGFFLLVTKDNMVYLNDSIEQSEFLIHLPDELKMIKSEKDSFLQNVVLPLSKKWKVNFDDNKTFKSEEKYLYLLKKQVYLSENDNSLIVIPHIVYDNEIEADLINSGNIIKNEDKKITVYVRDLEAEKDFLSYLSTLHPDFKDMSFQKFFYLSYEQVTRNMWFFDFFEKLQSKDIEVFGLKNLKNFKYSPYRATVATSIKSGQDWFDVSIDVSFGDNQIDLQQIKKAIINKQKFIQLKDGSVGILPEKWFEKLDKYFRNGEIAKDKLKISKLRFSVIDELFDNIDDAKIIEELAIKRKKLEAFTKITKTRIPKEMKANLRPYQKEGYNWLNFLEEMKWGGILADDMGLGKTLQILTFLQKVVKKNKTPNLIVVPTTLLFNWQIEIEKFAPELTTHYYYGIDRIKDTSEFSKHQLIFTTYGVLVRDIEIFHKYKFNYVILDESQAIKNPMSQRYKAVNLLKANNKITLTGTPIENNTFDLFAQMNFVNPGMLGTMKSFKENYSTPIDRDGNEEIAQELQKIINPFILRRTKEKVAKELPSKTENIIYCEMEPEQQKIYESYKNKYRNQLLKKISKDGLGKSKMFVLEGLMRLRQICDSPALLKDDSVDDSQQAVKIKEIVRHITNKTANHKLLIFSQFVEMLSLIKEELDKKHILYEYLDGKSTTKQREESVNNFQNDEKLRVFLISLRAGGTGLNLTAADYVYIVDPWWNPAVENQAIDRCYRIGQDKKVFAYRMICKNTVEEKIIELQSKKKKIANDIIQTEKGIMKSLKLNDIKKLFS